MHKKIIFLIIAIFLSGILTSCSKSSSPEFQYNDKFAPFSIFHLFDGYPALKAAWDSVPGSTGNAKLADMMNEDIVTGAEFMKIVSFLMDKADDNPGLELLDDLKSTIGFVNSTSVRLYGNSSLNNNNPIGSFFASDDDDPAKMVEYFYSMLDELTNDVGGTSPKVSASMMGMTEQLLDYVLAKSDSDIKTSIDDFMDDLTDPDFKGNFSDLMDILAPLMAIADYPMWIHEGSIPGEDSLETNYNLMKEGPSINSELGNMAKGVNMLLSGMFDMLNGETIDRESMYDLFDNLNKVLSNPETIKKLIWNMSNYFTPGGFKYKDLKTGNNDVDQYIYSTSSAQLYSDSNLSATLRELLTAAGDLFLRDDRRSSLGYRPGTTSTDYPLAYTLKNVKKAYINWDTAQIKESIYDLLRVDMFGRDRKNDPNAFSASFLEHLLYLGSIGINFGFEHKANANEVTDNPVYDAYSTVLREHGHGRQIGYVTLNDVLFSIQSQKNPLAGVGNYELGFEEVDVNNEATLVNKGRNRTFRSKNNFTSDNRAQYKFAFSVNYPAAWFLTGPTIGDFGVGKDLNGGNVKGGAGVDEFIPYSPTGKAINDMTSYTFAAVTRTCWEGEGPYYYKDPSAPTVTKNGFTGKKYLRPDGRIYALVNNSGEYFYPADGGNDIDEDSEGHSDGQRENRYRATWNTDYYMIEQEHLQQGETVKYYVPIEKEGPNDYLGRSTIEASVAPFETNPDGTKKYLAQCRSYSEIIPENYAGRGCASQEEAMFRNYQFLMNEKKIAFILPFWAAGEPQVLFNSDLVRAGIESAVFQVLEANGLSGFGAARKFRANNVWAKANTNGTSNVPGDYRMIVMAMPIRAELYLAGIWIVDPIGLTKATSAQVYSDILGKGSGLPGALAHNIYAISRFGLPRSPKISSGTNYEHYLIGSQKVSNPNGTSDVGFSTSDDIWKKRNSLMPLFVALMAPMFDKSYYNSRSDYNNALLKMLEGLSWLVKPLIYFNYDIGSEPGYTEFKGVAKNSWQVRVKGYGNSSYESEYKVKFSQSLVSDWDIYKNQSETIPPETAWFGSWKALNYYTPADIPTLISVLTDSDTSSNRSNRDQRADGLLGKLVAYPEFPNRPSVTEMPLNWKLSDKSSNAIDKICAGLEQLTTGMKGSKARGTEINEKMSLNDSFYLGYKAIKQLDPPEWRFKLRPRLGVPAKYIDLDLDDLLNRVIGKTPDKGLNKYRDDNAIYFDGKPVWTDITDIKPGKKYGDGAVDGLYMITNEFLVKNVNGSNHSISGYLFDILDVMAKHKLMADQVKGLQYTLAKLLAYFDGSKWVIQGDDSFNMLFDLLHVALPNIDTAMAEYADMTYGKDDPDRKGKVYKSLLKSMQIGSKNDALVAWILATATSEPYLSRDVLTELEMWLESDLISGTNTVFYSTMAEMLLKMGEMVAHSPSGGEFYSIYDQYGFQAN